MDDKKGSASVGLFLATLGCCLLGGSARIGLSAGETALSYTLLKTDAPHDAPSVVWCREQLFVSSNSSAILRIDPDAMRILEVKEYPGLGAMHQITTDGQMLYAAYFSYPGERPLSHGVIKVDPVDLSIVARLRLDDYGVVGWPEGFVWHDGYLYETAFGYRGLYGAHIARIESSSMTYAGAVALPGGEGCHGITYDGSHLYALGVPSVDSAAHPDHYYKIDADTLQIKAVLTLPGGLHHYGGNVYLARNGSVYTSPGYPEESRGGLVRIDAESFTVVDVLPGGGRHWLATEGRYVYLVEGDAVRVIDPDAMVSLGKSSPPFDRGLSTLHYGYVASDGYLYLGYENVGHRGVVGKMTTFLPGDRTPPSAAGDLKAAALEGLVRLRWGPAEDPESSVLEYRIYRGLADGPAEHLVSVPGPSQRFTDRSAEPGKTYRYEIAAVNGSGREGPRAVTPPILNAASRVPAGSPVEIPLDSPALPDEAWVRAVFISPSGRRHTVAGAYDGPGRWKVRYVPDEAGPWRYAISSSEVSMAKFGGFECSPAGRGGRRRSPVGKL